MAESVFDKKKRVRPPRVHITYEVELGGAMQMKELPFVVGVMSDLSGNPAESLGKLKDRKFIEVDRDNFDDVLKSMKPRVAMKVKNTLSEDPDAEMGVELNFNKLADFEPEAIANQVPVLKKLLETRGKLKDLQSRVEGNDRLEEMLDEVIKDSTLRDKLKDATGAEAPSLSGGDEGDASGEATE